MHIKSDFEKIRGVNDIFSPNAPDWVKKTISVYSNIPWIMIIFTELINMIISTINFFFLKKLINFYHVRD